MPILTAYSEVSIGGTIYTQIRAEDISTLKRLNSVSVSCPARPFLYFDILVCDKNVPEGTQPTTGDMNVINYDMMNQNLLGEGVAFLQCNVLFRGLVQVGVFETVAGDRIRVEINYEVVK